MKEIVSFNEVMDLASLLELDGAELDRVVGGAGDSLAEDSCILFKGSCSDLSHCTGYMVEPEPSP